MAPELGQRRHLGHQPPRDEEGVAAEDKVKAVKDEVLIIGTSMTVLNDLDHRHMFHLPIHYLPKPTTIQCRRSGTRLTTGTANAVPTL